MGEARGDADDADGVADTEHVRNRTRRVTPRSCGANADVATAVVIEAAVSARPSPARRRLAAADPRPSRLCPTRSPRQWTSKFTPKKYRKERSAIMFLIYLKDCCINLHGHGEKCEMLA